MSRPFEKSDIDADLLGRLLDEHGAALALYAAQWTDAADDCVQEALVELARQPNRPQHLVAWLYRVVKNRALNMARAAQRRRLRESRSMASRFELAHSRNQFDRKSEIAVVEALDELEHAEREVVVMRIWGGLTFEEIAEATSSSTSSVHRRYVKALSCLRNVLDSSCVNQKKTTNSTSRH